MNKHDCGNAHPWLVMYHCNYPGAAYGTFNMAARAVLSMVVTNVKSRMRYAIPPASRVADTSSAREPNSARGLAPLARRDDVTDVTTFWGDTIVQFRKYVSYLHA